LRALLFNPNQMRLVTKPGKIYNRIWPPLELANSAALLEAEGHSVRITDAHALGMKPEHVTRCAVGFDKVFISSSSLDRWQCPTPDLGPFLASVERLRKTTDEVYVLGVHGTLRPQEILNLTAARAVIRGEPEGTIVEICRGTPLRDIRGIAFREDGRIIVNQDREPVNLDELPPPALHLLPMEKYCYEVLGPRFTLFEGSRGCASRCSFCLLAMYGRGLRRKSPARLIREVDLAISRFGVKTAYFMDLEFTAIRGAVMELCDHLIRKRYDFRWTCQTRLDLVDEELLESMRRAGCRLIHFGVEAGTDRFLNKINKGITTAQIRDGLGLVRRAGIDSACFFMLGFPDEDEDELERTVRFARELNPTYALFHQVTPYPGTPLYDEIQKNAPSIFAEGPFPEACFDGEALKKLKRTIRRAYLGYYLRPGYIAARLSRGDLRSLLGQVKLLWGYL